MSEAKDLGAVQGIKRGIDAQLDAASISRKIYLCYSTFAFKDAPDDEFTVRDAIASKFKIPLSSVQVAGSAKTGISFWNSTLFSPDSDLDIALLSLELFVGLQQAAFRATSGFTDLTAFPFPKAVRIFGHNLSIGSINPFYMPDCPEKTDLLDFFRNLSNDYTHLFKDISGVVYMNELFFNEKQKANIDLYLKNQQAYDSIPNTP
jgi:hypothetical protein